MRFRKALSSQHIILKTAAENEKDVQDTDVHRKFEKCVVTLLVMSAFSDFLGASRACAFFRDAAAVIRIMPLAQLFVCLVLLFGMQPCFAKKPHIDPELREKLKKTIAESDSFEDKFDAQVWLVQKSAVLQRYVKDHDKRLFILKEVHRAATSADVSPEFVLAVIQIESLFDPYAVSSAGAMGMMQVMPFWKKEIGRESDNLIDIRTNLKYGCTILKHYLGVAKGDWKEALARYNGSYGQYWYPEKVMVAWQKYWR